MKVDVFLRRNHEIEKRTILIQKIQEIFLGNCPLISFMCMYIQIGQKTLNFI